jgi:hypothetical protein
VIINKSELKKYIFIVIALPLIFYGLRSTAKHFWRGDTLSTSKVCKKWGEAAFNENQFLNGDEKVRAKMACSILKNQKQFIGQSRLEIRKKLGDFDGFYFSDMFPAYIIESGKTREQDTWQIVFMLDRKEKISEIIVHKNCCDK